MTGEIDADEHLVRRSDEALKILASELGSPVQATGRRLRRIRKAIEKLLQADPESPWAVEWRADLRALSSPPAQIPHGRDE